MDVTVGKKYQHRMTGLQGTIIANDGNRHRVILRLDDGRELQEVPYHDLLDNPPPQPVSGPLPVQSPGPDETTHPDPAEDASRDASKSKQTGWEPPRRAS